MPQTQFSTLVLPAPLGPMRHSNSASRVANDKSCNTRRPPNARPTSRTSRQLLSAIPAAVTAVLLDFAVAALPLAAQAKVELADVRVLAQGIRRAGEHDATVLEHVCVVVDVERDRRVVTYQQHRHAEIAADLLQASNQFSG